MSEFTYKSPDGSLIEDKEDLRDLGVQISYDVTLSTHIQNTISNIGDVGCDPTSEHHPPPQKKKERRR